MTDHSANEDAEIRAAQRDALSFTPLYERYADAVFGYCLRRLGDVDIAADTTSDVFMRALDNIGRYHGSSFRSWLFAIARNAVIDRYRNRKPAAPWPEFVASSQPGPERIALQRETDSELRRALTQLSDQQQEVVNLRLAGLTGNEIASAMNMSLGAVKATQSRAFARLRELMSSYVTEVHHE